jgi:hypothetical protein
MAIFSGHGTGVADRTDIEHILIERIAEAPRIESGPASQDRPGSIRQRRESLAEPRRTHVTGLFHSYPPNMQTKSALAPSQMVSRSPHVPAGMTNFQLSNIFPIPLVTFLLRRDVGLQIGGD